MPKETILEWCTRNGKRGQQIYDGFMRCEAENRAEGIFIDHYYEQKTKVHLKCEEGHEMYYTLQRIKQDAWCRKCRWKEVNNERMAKQIETGKAVSLEQWCYANPDRGNMIINGYKRREAENLRDNLDIKKIHYTSSKAKMHFQCDYGHNFDSYAYQVSLHGNWCPDCAKGIQGKAQHITKLKQRGSLKDWIEEDIEHRKYVLDGFNRCKSLNIGVDLSDLPRATPDIKLWMSCSNPAHNPWQIRVSDITTGRWCPYCGHKTSFPEQLVYFWCKANFKDVENRVNIKSGDIVKEADILIKDLNLVIEYQGQYYHQGREEHDKYKRQFFKSLGYRELEIFGSLSGETKIDTTGILHNQKKDSYCTELVHRLVEWFKIVYDIDVTHKDMNISILNKAKAVMNK